MNWFPNQKVPDDVRNHIVLDLPVWAHNVPFEREICNEVASNKYGWPFLQDSQLNCTMALGHAMALPGSLENMAPALGLDVKKDAQGKRLMLKMCQPRSINEVTGEITWWNEPGDLERLAEYGRQDIIVEREIKKRLLRLNEKERKVWELDQRINSRGVQIDVRAAKTAIQIVEMELDRLNADMKRVTGNEVATATATAQLTKFLKDFGLDVDGVAKNDVIELLDLEELPEVCREALLIRQEAAKSSTAKLKMMIDGVGTDGRIRGIFQYSGAGSTGRWAGRRIQPQNFPRPKMDQVEIDKVFKLLEGVR